MKTDLSHLPANKQRELRLIVETITAQADVHPSSGPVLTFQHSAAANLPVASGGAS